MATLGLPEEISEEILLRLPVKSLLRFKSVSKAWGYLMSSSRFAKRQFNFQRAIPNSFWTQNILISSQEDLKFTRDSQFCYGAETQTLDFPAKRAEERVKILGSCNGLVAVALDHTQNLYIWNPSIGDHTKLPDPGLPNDDHLVCGFGYDSSSEDYVLFMATYGRDVEVKVKGKGKRKVEVEVEMATTSRLEAKYYSWRKNKWSSVSKPPSPVKTFYYNKGIEERCAFVRGGLHWRLQAVFGKFLAFDLKTKRFKRVPIKPELTCNYFCLGGIEDKLCLVTRYNDVRRPPDELWVMEEYGNNESWTKRYNIRNAGNIFFDRGCFVCDTYHWEKPKKTNHLRFAMKERITTQFLRSVVAIEAAKETTRRTMWLKTAQGIQTCNHQKCLEVIAYTETLFSPHLHHPYSKHKETIEDKRRRRGGEEKEKGHKSVRNRKRPLPS